MNPHHAHRTSRPIACVRPAAAAFGIRWIRTLALTCAAFALAGVAGAQTQVWFDSNSTTSGSGNTSVTWGTNSGSYWSSNSNGTASPTMWNSAGGGSTSIKSATFSAGSNENAAMERA